MKTKEEKLIDAIGDTKDSNVLRAVGHESADPSLKTEVHHVEFVEAPKISEADVKRYRIRNGVLGGLAAAVALTGGLVLWNNLRESGVFPKPAESSVTEPIIEEAIPDIRNLKWGMTVDEVKAHETETLTLQQDDVGSADRLQTLLNYDDVRYKNFNSKMVLCVDNSDGLNGVNYHIDTETYPNAFSELKEVLAAEYGEYNDNYGNLEWSMPDSNLTVCLFNWQTVVQVGFYPYVDMSEIDESDKDAFPRLDDSDDSEFSYDNEMDLDTWKQRDDIMLDIYPSDLPKTRAEYEYAGVPDDFDRSEFRENGYPRVMLAYIPNADAPEGDYDVYLLARSVYADEDDDNIVYGSLVVGIAERGSDKLFDLNEVSGDYGILMRIDTDKIIDKYIQIFRMKDENGENHMILKCAYGENDSEYETTFYQVRDGQLSLFWKIAGYVSNDPYVAEMEGVGMKLSAELEQSGQNGNEILDNRNGMAFSFDYEENEISIRTFEPVDVAEEEEETYPESRETVEKIRTFDITTHNYISHDYNSDEMSVFDSDVLVADDRAYILMERWMNSETLLSEAKRALSENYAGFEATVKPYCNENGGFDYQKAIAIPNAPLATRLFEDREYFPSSYDYRVLNDDWLIDFKEDVVTVYMKNDQLTAFRRAAEYLWSIFDEYPEMTVTAIYNFDTKESYLLVISGECQEIKAAMQRDCDKDISDCCRFMTSGDIKSTWLPLNMFRESDGKTYFEYVDNYDQYNVAFDDRVYTGTSWGTAHDIANKMKELGMITQSKTFLKETKNLPQTVNSRKEFAKVLHENIKSFDRITPYASIFDPVKLPRNYDNGGFSFYYSVGSQVIEVMASPHDVDNAGDYGIHYRLLQYAGYLTQTRYIVKNFRDNYTFSDPDNGYKGYVIRGIEVVDDGEKKVRLIADESMWEEIEQINGEGLHLMPGDLVFASEPTDTSGMTVYKP